MIIRIIWARFLMINYVSNMNFCNSKVKIYWLQKGERNSKFFYAKMSVRRHKHKIHALLHSQGNYIYDSDSIRHEAIEYYQLLFNGDTPPAQPFITTRMQINNSRTEYLSSPITMEEIGR